MCCNGRLGFLLVRREKKARVYLLPDVTALKMRVLTFVVLDLVRGCITAKLRLILESIHWNRLRDVYENSSVTVSTDVRRRLLQWNMNFRYRTHCYKISILCPKISNFLFSWKYCGDKILSKIKYFFENFSNPENYNFFVKNEKKDSPNPIRMPKTVVSTI